jgi:hypothetical protein
MKDLCPHPGPGTRRAGLGVLTLVGTLAIALSAAKALGNESKAVGDAEAMPLATPEPEAFPRVSGSPGNGITLQTGHDFSFNIKSRFQLRYQLNITPEDDEGRRDQKQLATVGTLRLSFSGLVLKPELTYMIQLALAARDYRDGATSPVYDAYLDWKLHRDFSLRAGQFFVQFDRLRTVRESALQLADRSRPVQELTLDRDIGITAYSEALFHDDSPLALRLGLWSGGGPNANTEKKPGMLLVGRVELRPLGPIDDDSDGDLLRRKSPGLALGTGLARAYRSNRQRTTTGATFSGGTTNVTQAAADLVFKWRGAALQGELLWKESSKDQIESVDAAGLAVVEHTRSGSGWVLQSSYTFDPPFELVARVSRLRAARGTDPVFRGDTSAKGDELAGGANYYFNGHKLKLQANWIGRMPPGFRLRAADHLVHVQLDGTF